ncbi:signal recognition particle receptor subunit alpha, partial [bacterium]|nr:signal recognition particle receptor subunit alpha [bacterium]
MFDNLSDKLQEIIRKASGNATLTEENMSDALREVRRALLDADVSLKVVKIFMTSLKEKALGEDVLKGVNPSQQLIKIVHDELVNILGNENKPLVLDGHPSLIMMLGLQGSGKTTSAAKLAIKLKKEGKNPLLVAADVYRPAAITQLKTLGEQTQTPVFTIDSSTNVQHIVSQAIEHAKNNGFNVVIIDTAGRLQIDNEMMAELLLIDRAFKPQEKLL